MKKWILRISVFSILTPTTLLILWYSISFLPYLNKINGLAESGNETIKPIYRSFYPLAVAGETKERIRIHAMRQTYWFLVYSKNHSKVIGWQLNNLLWYFASEIHLTDQEVFGLWVNCALYGCEKGLSEASQIHYNKFLDELSIQEQAGLIALVRSPSRYRVGSEKYENRIREIIEKAAGHNNTLMRDRR